MAITAEQQNSRLEGPKPPKGKIVLQAPPELEPSDGVNTLLTSLVPLLGTASAMVMMLMTNSGLTGMLTGGMFMVSSLGFVAVNGFRQRSQRMANLAAARREYLTYLAGIRKTVRTAGRKQRNAALWNAPSPSSLTAIAQEPERCWERVPADDDFMILRCGTHSVPLCLQLESPELPPLAQLDPVSASAAHRFMLAHKTLHNMPYGIDLRKYKRVELLGNESQTQALARAMICQAAVWHPAECCRVLVLASADRMGQWEWVRLLPHNRVLNEKYLEGTYNGHGFMLTSNVREVDALIGEEVLNRNRRTGDNEIAPHVLVINDGFDRTVLSRESRLFAEDGLGGVTVFDMPNDWGELEEDDVLRVLYSQTVVEEGLNVLEKRDINMVEVFSTALKPVEIQPDELTVEEALCIAKRLTIRQSQEIPRIA